MKSAKEQDRVVLYVGKKSGNAAAVPMWTGAAAGMGREDIAGAGSC